MLHLIPICTEGTIHDQKRENDALMS
jgi:hypothetical protein